ncbi:hypothetical protein Fot_19633 [Forsythia ovata]|uniref:Uncharacterized protein n=1 Tax=Forsythia ovata TaxID=205694 RepID=A0ABD1VLK2_9LAMI
MSEGSYSIIGGLRTCLEQVRTYNSPQQQENNERGLTFNNWRPYKLALDNRGLITFLNNKKPRNEGSPSTFGGRTNFPRTNVDLQLASTIRKLLARVYYQELEALQTCLR